MHKMYSNNFWGFFLIHKLSLCWFAQLSSGCDLRLITLKVRERLARTDQHFLFLSPTTTFPSAYTKPRIFFFISFPMLFRLNLNGDGMLVAWWNNNAGVEWWKCLSDFWISKKTKANFNNHKFLLTFAALLIRFTTEKNSPELHPLMPNQQKIFREMPEH